MLLPVIPDLRIRVENPGPCPSRLPISPVSPSNAGAAQGLQQPALSMHAVFPQQTDLSPVSPTVLVPGKHQHATLPSNDVARSLHTLRKKSLPLCEKEANGSSYGAHQCEPTTVIDGCEEAQGGNVEDVSCDHEMHIQTVDEECLVDEDGLERQRSRLDLLPMELLEQIISNLALDIPPNGATPRNMDLVSCLLTNRALHSATLLVLYRKITFPTSSIFSKFLARLRACPDIGDLVRRLDFSHFSSLGLGRTMKMNAAIQNLTCNTLLACLQLLPCLQECLFQEHLENDISAAIIHRLLSETPSLIALDFCGCSSEQFSAAFMHACSSSSVSRSSLLKLKRLSLHECTSLLPDVFCSLLRHLTNLTHLDVAYTQITIEALQSIPHTARLTHLNLSRCSRLRGDDVVGFLTTHPAVCNNSLIYLNLMTDASRSRLCNEQHMDVLLPRLGRQLRSLNIGGSRLNSAHVTHLRALCTHLEELGLAMVGLELEDINNILRPTTSTSTSTSTWKSTLRYIDLTSTIGLTHATLNNRRTSLLTTEHSAPLTVIELSLATIRPLRDRQQSYAHGTVITSFASPTFSSSSGSTAASSPTSQTSQALPADVELSARYGNGWVVRDIGRRLWYVRGSGAAGARESGVVGSGCEAGEADCGRRAWKMGAWWWGMRKVPVSVGDVGGLYGHYMFKR